MTVPVPVPVPVTVTVTVTVPLQGGGGGHQRGLAAAGVPHHAGAEVAHPTYQHSQTPRTRRRPAAQQHPVRRSAPPGEKRQTQRYD
eukprot:7256659-Pyramimonas_sp.AAC.1